MRTAKMLVDCTQVSLASPCGVRWTWMVAIYLAVITSGVHAVNFPYADGPDASGMFDMSSASAWGGSIPGTTDAVAFTGKTSRVITASSDVTFGQLQNCLSAAWNNKLTLTFDMTGQEGRKLNLAGFLGSNGRQDYVSAVFKGGYWDLGGQYFLNSSSQSYGEYRTVMLSDGAIITNTASLSLAYTNQKGVRLVLAGASQLHVGGKLAFSQVNTAYNDNNHIMVTNGSTMTVIGELSWDAAPGSWSTAVSREPDDDLRYYDKLIVDGDGSKFVSLCSGTDSFNNLSRAGGGALIIRNKGYFESPASYFIVGSIYARYNLLRVESQGHAEINNLWVGIWGSPTGIDGLRHHRIEVLDGGVLDCTGTTYLSYGSLESGNTLLVSNGVFKASQFFLADNVATTNQCVRIQGQDAVFEVTGGCDMFPCSHSEWTVELGAQISAAQNFSINESKTGIHDNVLRVATGAAITNVAMATTTKKWATGVIAWNNKIIAESGATVTGSVVSIVGSNCVFRVDDATVILSGKNGLNIAPYGSGTLQGGVSTNCALEVAGTDPKITLSGNLVVKNDSRILFELPQAGFADNTPRISVGGAVTVDSGSAIEFTGAEAMLATLQENHTAAEYVLMENPDTEDFVGDEIVAAAQASLGDSFKLRKRVSGGKNQLVLKGGFQPAFVIIVR